MSFFSIGFRLLHFLKKSEPPVLRKILNLPLSFISSQKVDYKWKYLKTSHLFLLFLERSRERRMKHRSFSWKWRKEVMCKGERWNWKETGMKWWGMRKEWEGERLSSDMKERHIIELRTPKPSQGTAITKPNSCRLQKCYKHGTAWKSAGVSCELPTTARSPVLSEVTWSPRSADGPSASPVFLTWLGSEL